jgi:hypothetical protein
MLGGLAATAVVAGVLLSRAPSARPVTSAVSYSFAAHQYDDGLVAVRRWILGGRHGSLFTESITASSASGKTLLVPFEEPIPAAIAANLKTVRFTPAPSKIVNADPVVEWELRVPAHGTVTVGYQATVAPVGATMIRLTQWVKDFNQLAPTFKLGPVQIQSLKISPPTIQIGPGQAVQLTLGGLMSDGRSAARTILADVVWQTGDPAVATVNSFGMITGNAQGETPVTARVGDIRATCIVTVINQTGTESPSTAPPGPSTASATPTGILGPSIPTPTPAPTPSPTPFPSS